MNRRTIHEMLEEARSSLDRLEPEAAHRAMDEGAVLIDTRSTDDVRRTGSVPGALHIPLSVLEWRVDASSETHDPAVGNGRIILLCAHGYSSSLAAKRLQDLGFADATDVIGGFEGWVAAGLPVATADRATDLPG
jgi:rhodanese-related sulfurtransferase